MGTIHGTIVNRQGIACTFGVNTLTIDQWMMEGCPVFKVGSAGKAYEFNTADVYEWRIAKITGTAPRSQLQLSAIQEKARRDKESADQIALRNKVVRGELIKIEDVTRAVTAAFGMVRQRLLSMPAKLAPELALIESAPAIQERITDGVNEALAELERASIPKQSSPSDPDLALDPEASTEVDSEPVGGREEGAQRRKQRGARKVAHKSSRVPAGRDGRDKRSVHPSSGRA